MPLDFIESRILRELAGVLTLSMLLLLPGVAVAQDVAVSLDELLRSGSLQLGEGVYVTDATGRRLKGTLSDVSSTGLVVTHRGQSWTVAAADVRRIDLQDSLRNGTAYGMVAVAGPITAVCGAGGSHPGECAYMLLYFRSWRSAAPWALSSTLSGTRRSTARPGRCRHPCHRSCRRGVSAHRYRSVGEPTSRVTRFADVVSQQRVLGESSFFVLRLVLAPVDVSRHSLSTTFLMGSSTRTSASPAWAATTMSVTLPSPVLFGSTIATWAGLMKTSPSWRLPPSRPVVPAVIERVRPRVVHRYGNRLLEVFARPASRQAGGSAGCRFGLWWVRAAGGGGRR